MASKRDRELARAKWERQQTRRKQAQEKQSVVKRSVLAGFAVVAVIVIVLSNQGNSSTSSAPTTQTNPPTPTSVPSNTPVTSTPTPTTKQVCAPHGALTTAAKQFASAPTQGPAAASLQLQTNCGNIDILLDKKAPKTTTIMSNLAKSGYFDNTPCHRLTTNGIYVLQCGDPTGTGTGGPGFKYADENLPKVSTGSSFVYSRGTIAMANSGPGTNGSQFFIVYKASPLPPNYTVWGQVTSGIDVVDKIAAAGEQTGAGDGKPNADVAILKAVAR